MKKYIKVEYPESQSFIGRPGFSSNSELCNSTGDPTFLVEETWYRKNSKSLRNEYMDLLGIFLARNSFKCDFIDYIISIHIKCTMLPLQMVSLESINKIISLTKEMFGNIVSVNLSGLMEDQLSIFIKLKYKFV